MKDKTRNLQKQFKKAFGKLDESLNLPKNEIVRDSAIQRFEFTFELLWKTFKAMLEEKGAKELYFPRDVIKEAFRAKLIEENEEWLDMLESRNQTSHLYKEEMAEKIYALLPGYRNLIKSFLDTI